MGGWARSWLLGLIAVAVAVTAGVLAGLGLDPLVGDHLVVRAGNWSPPSRDVVLVAIDEDSIADLPYRSPIDRGFLAEIVSKIVAAKPKAIGIDILFDQPSEARKDDALRSAIGFAEMPVVVATDASRNLTGRQAAWHASFTAGMTTGLATLRRDESDRVVRDAFVRGLADGKWRSGLAAAMLEALDPDRRPKGGLLAYFPDPDGRPHAFVRYPAKTVKLLPADWFKDKYVLIGATLSGTDRHPTPFATVFGSEVGTLYGVEIHAHMLAQFLGHIQIRRLSGPLVGLASLLAALLAGLCFRPHWHLAVRVGLFLAGIAAYWAGVWFAFRGGPLLLPAAGPVVAALVSGIYFGIKYWNRDRAQRRFIEKAFSQYVSPALVKRIIDRRSAVVLGGEKRTMTFVFTDLEGFTSLSESMEPDRLAELLNTYLDRMCELFVEAEATIDKIVGDAVVGFFGAPEKQTDQSPRAVDLAFAIDRMSEAFRAECEVKGIELGATRIGIHRGEAIVGNFGGSRFFDYTAIGDTVNTAARLESANRHLGTRIMVSGSVVAVCPGRSFRPIGSLRLKGKGVPVACFEPIPKERMGDREYEIYRIAYESLANDDPEATKAFAEARELSPDDPLVRFHHKRLMGGAHGTVIELVGK